MVSRRRFLRHSALIAGGALVSSLASACAQTPAAPPAKPTEAPKPAAPAAKPTEAAKPAAAAPTSPPPAAKPAEAPKPTAAAQAAPAAAKPGGKLIVALEADPFVFDPAFTSVPGRRVGRAIYDPLIELDEQGKAQPGLIERWEQPNDTTYVFHARPGVKFHDGTDFNAEAVKLHFDRHLDPQVGSFRRSEVGPVDRVEVTGPLTATIHLKEPYSPFLFGLFDWAGFVISPTAWEKWGKEQYRFNPVGTGPFKFASYAKDQETVVERNPDYWRKGEPLLDSIVFRAIPVDSTRLTELRSGGVHIVEDFPFQNIQQLRSASEFVVSEKQGFRWDAFMYNNRKEPWASSQKLRQALNWALDREAIQKSVYFDTGQIGFDPFLPDTPYFDPSYKPFTRDLDRAKRLVDESGVSGPIELAAVHGQDQPQQRALQIAQANLEEIGITLSIQIVDVAAQLEHYRSGNYEFGLNWWGYRPDPDGWIHQKYHSKGSQNYYGYYNNPKADELIDQARRVSDVQQRVRLYRQLAELINEDAPQIFFHYGSNIKGISNKVKGFVHWQDSMIRFQKITVE